MRLIIKGGLYSWAAFIVLVATPSNKNFARIFKNVLFALSSEVYREHVIVAMFKSCKFSGLLKHGNKSTKRSSRNLSIRAG